MPLSVMQPGAGGCAEDAGGGGVLRDSLPISEMFLSIQGEGKLTGVPSFFIRTSGCNLRCWWCDTPYASWKPEGLVRAIDELVAMASASGAKHVVVTGGEPMLFPQIGALCERLRGAGLHITIETAGTVFRSVACDLMSISPKLTNSTPGEARPFPPGHAAGKMPRDALRQWGEQHEARRLNMPALRELLGAFPERQLKFVVAGPQDLAEIDDLLAQLPGVLPADVMLMPEGVSSPSAETKAWVIDACMARGFRYCQRLHIELFGNTRGT